MTLTTEHLQAAVDAAEAVTPESVRAGRFTPEQFKAWRAAQKQDHRYKIRPNPGFVPNPLRAYGRNDPCLCGSHKKWKKCCGPDTPLFIPKDDLEDHRKVLNGEPIE